MKAPILALMNALKRKTKIKILFFLLVLFTGNFGYTQTHNDYSLLFYNVENLFDPEDAPGKVDDEFTPEGDRHWRNNLLNQKLVNISKVLLSASGWSPPEMIALCEIENREVLERLKSQTPLKNFPYKIIHKESPDDRGIDVAFLYNADVFYPLDYAGYPVKDDQGSILPTREILYVSGIMAGIDTLHIFINHWPSRYSGLLETQRKRELAALTLRCRLDSLIAHYSNPKIVIVGDFNDQPSDESIVLHLNAQPVSEEIKPDVLYNLSARWGDNKKGTLKYRAQWFVFDQIMVSGTLLKSNAGLSTSPENASVINLPFLLEKDDRYGGFKPNRTFSGYTYKGGFSDHLPVLLKLNLKD